MQTIAILLISTIFYTVIFNTAQSVDSSCSPGYVRSGCYNHKESNLILQERNITQEFKGFILDFACRCAKAVKKENEHRNKFQGFALATYAASVWYCYGRTTSEMEPSKIIRGSTRPCFSPTLTDVCRLRYKTCIGLTHKFMENEFAYKFTDRGENPRSLLWNERAFREVV